MNMAKSDRLKGRKTLQVGNFLDEFEKDDIKKEVDIVRLFQHFGVGLTKKGKSYLGKCPWHDDRNPSLSVDRSKGLYNCFGCGESGDIFTLTEKMKGLSFRESVTYLKEFTDGMDPQKGGKSSLVLKDRGGVEPDRAETGKGRGDEEVPPAGTGMTLTTVAEYYHKKLFDNPEAIEYLKSRGFADIRILTRFQLGFADGSIFEKLSDTQKDSLKQQGIITEKGRENFKDCVTVPIFDDMGQVVGMYGRSINPKAKVPHLYLKGKHRSVFNRKASGIYDEIILTESIIDALSLVHLGFENTQSIYGAGGFTDEHLRILKDDRVKTIIPAFDADGPGREASERLKEKLCAEGFAVKVLNLHKSPFIKGENEESEQGDLKDWNEYLCSGGTKEKIRDAIEKAEVFTDEQEDTHFKAEKDHPGYIFTVGGISYRVTGVKEMFISNLRVNIKATLRPGADTCPSALPGAGTGLRYYDNLDLYSARSRSSYAGNMGRTLDIEPNRVEKDLIAILEYLERERDRHLLAGSGMDRETELTPQERELGLSFLKSPDMFTEIVEDMTLLGYVGEDLNKQLIYLTATSRRLDDPLSVMVISESASGKSLLIDTVARLIPPDEVISVTSLSEQALNYMEDLSHKFVSLGEIMHSEMVEHQIREMLSKRELSRLVATKEPQTGKLVTRLVKIPAVVALAVSGTRYDMNPENTSRCFMVNADESREQTRRIHEQQWTRKYSLRRKNEKKELIPEIIRKHHAAQKLLEPVAIDNTFGDHLDFPSTLMRTRRDNERFVDLIACVCFLRQYQKEKKYDTNNEPYIEFDLSDYETAYRIMTGGVLSSSLLEIPGGAIELYEHFRELTKKRGKKENIEARDVSLTQREIREYTGLNHVWVKRHMRVLLDYEYIILARGGRARSKGHYRLRDDVPMEEVNLSMIPTPDELKQKLEAQK